MKIVELTNPKIFVDMDGVLCDFEGGVEKLLGVPLDDEQYSNDPQYKQNMWDAITDTYSGDNPTQWWYDLLPLDDMQLWKYIEHHNPEILTATGKSEHEDEVSSQKRRWVKDNINSDVIVHIVQSAENKCTFAHKNNILIDDRLAAITPWREAGGIGILHTDINNTIDQLAKLGI